MEATFGWGWRESVGEMLSLDDMSLAVVYCCCFFCDLWMVGWSKQNLAPFIDLPRSVQHFQNVTTCYLFTTFKNVVHCRSVVLVCGLRAWSLEIPPRYDFSMTDHCSTCLPCRQVFFWDFNLGGPLYLLMAGLNYWFVFVMIGHDVLKIQHVSFFLKLSTVYTLNFTREKSMLCFHCFRVWTVVTATPQKTDWPSIFLVAGCAQGPPSPGGFGPQ